MPASAEPMSPDKDPPKSERKTNGSQGHEKEIIGDCFVQLCNQGREFLARDLEARLRDFGPEGSVTTVFRPTGAEELYFAETREGSAQTYWLVSYAQKYYLVPCPATSMRFEGIQGFQLTRDGGCTPASIAACEPAELRRKGGRWGIKTFGKLA